MQCLIVNILSSPNSAKPSALIMRRLKGKFIQKWKFCHYLEVDGDSFWNLKKTWT